MSLFNVRGLQTLTKSYQALGTCSLVRSLSTTNSASFRTAPVIMSMPSKKKNKIDPAVIKAREEKRKKRLVKALKKLNRKERMPKPVSEMDVPQVLLKERGMRQRGITVSEELEEDRIHQFKDWARFSYKRHKREIFQIDRVIISQKSALEQLRLLNEDLYRQAILPDSNLIPFTAQGPYNTPAIPDYIQDGEYEDVTRKYEIQYAGDVNEQLVQMMKQMAVSKRRNRKPKKEDDE